METKATVEDEVIGGCYKIVKMPATKAKPV
jgi:hypothetical protein